MKSGRRSGFPDGALPVGNVPGRGSPRSGGPSGAALPAFPASGGGLGEAHKCHSYDPINVIIWG